MDGEAAYNGDFQFDHLGTGRIVGVAHVSPRVLRPRRLQHEDPRSRVDPLRIEDHRGPRHGLAEPQIHGWRNSLRDAGEDDRLPRPYRRWTHSFVEPRRNRGVRV